MSYLIKILLFQKKNITWQMLDITILTIFFIYIVVLDISYKNKLLLVKDLPIRKNYLIFVTYKDIAT